MADRTDQVPEADLLEQQVALDPQTLTDSEQPDVGDLSDELVDHVDRWEQLLPVPGDGDDDYPRDGDDPYAGDEEVPDD